MYFCTNVTVLYIWNSTICAWWYTSTEWLKTIGSLKCLSVVSSESSSRPILLNRCSHLERFSFNLPVHLTSVWVIFRFFYYLPNKKVKFTLLTILSIQSIELTVFNCYIIDLTKLKFYTISFTAHPHSPETTILLCVFMILTTLDISYSGIMWYLVFVLWFGLFTSA